ncbi:MAG TPA: GNAT family N-acetyltransferase [Solirubrobacteraceae bacterium]|nr:GNAT family N-acetyltransferase [Solirubrobacteraceae bacterium]
MWLARRAEAETVAELLVGFRDDLGYTWPPAASFLASVLILIERPDTEYLLAAAGEDAHAAGVCQLRFRHSVWTATEDCWLEDLFVAPEARRQGLARALVERSLARARERGCRRVELDTDEDNRAALALYESVGFSARNKGGSRSLLLGVPLER